MTKGNAEPDEILESHVVVRHKPRWGLPAVTTRDTRCSFFTIRHVPSALRSVAAFI